MVLHGIGKENSHFEVRLCVLDTSVIESTKFGILCLQECHLMYHFICLIDAENGLCSMSSKFCFNFWSPFFVLLM